MCDEFLMGCTLLTASVHLCVLLSVSLCLQHNSLLRKYECKILCLLLFAVWWEQNSSEWVSVRSIYIRMATVTRTKDTGSHWREFFY